MSWLLLACTGAAPVTTTATPCDYCDGDCVDESQGLVSSSHEEGDLTYDDPPPTSGDHNACWTEWGVHAEDPGDERWVHNEEHGGVVILYQPADCASGDSGGNDCAAEVDALAAILGTKGDPRWVITPYDDLPTAWGAVSWGERRLMGCFDLGALVEFFDAHVGHGSEDVESGPSSACME